MSTAGLHLIKREILRCEGELQRSNYGKTRRTELETRVKALRWAVHVLLTADPTTPPGAEVDAFLGALRPSEGERREP